jgi:hypothetical protein
MSNNEYIKNEALVESMLKQRKYSKEDGYNPFDMGYLVSFMAGAMEEIPELRQRVEERILLNIKLDAIAENAVSNKS